MQFNIKNVYIYEIYYEVMYSWWLLYISITSLCGKRYKYYEQSHRYGTNKVISKACVISHQILPESELIVFFNFFTTKTCHAADK